MKPLHPYPSSHEPEWEFLGTIDDHDIYDPRWARVQGVHNDNPCYCVVRPSGATTWTDYPDCPANIRDFALAREAMLS